MNFIITSLATLLLLIQLTSCGQPTMPDTREYNFVINNTNTLFIDSVVVIRTSGIITDTLHFYNGSDFIQTDSILDIDFMINANTSELIEITKTVYSFNVPIIQSHTSFHLLDDSPVIITVKDEQAITIMKNFYTVAILDTTIDLIEKSDILDSLFIAHALDAEDTIAVLIYETFKKRTVSDSARYISMLQNALYSDSLGTQNSALITKTGLSPGNLEIVLQAYADTAIESYEGPLFIINGTLTGRFTIIDSVSLILSHQNETTSAKYNSLLGTYSGSLRRVGLDSNYILTILLFDSNSLMTGISSQTLASFNSTVSITAFDSHNAIPEIVLSTKADSITKSDSITFTWEGTILHNPITEYEFKSANDETWTDMGLQNNIVVSNPKKKGSYDYFLSALDSVGNIVFDTVTVNIINRLPTAENQNFYISENDFQEIGTLFAIDDDQEILTYWIQEGPTDIFNVDAITGIIGLNDVLDYEEFSEHSLTISISDGEDTVTIDATIYVTNINDNTPYFNIGDILPLTIAEDHDTTFTLNATDNDNDLLSWTILKGTTLATVEIESTTGIFSYYANPNVSGIDTVIILVSDSKKTDTLTMPLTIIAVYDSVEYTGTPTLTGAYSEGNTISVDPGESCAGIDNSNAQFSIAWFKDNDMVGYDGSEITGASDSTFVLTKNEGGAFIYVEVSCVGGNTMTKRVYAHSTVQYSERLEIDSLIDDRDNSNYDIVYIGSQAWMAENLNYSGDNTSDSVGYCYGNTDHSEGVNCSTYGRLYSWFTATGIQGVCPSGWHIPSDDEWQVLTEYTIDANHLKASSLWETSGVDTYNFQALPGGYSTLNGTGAELGQSGVWWSITEDGFGDVWVQSIINSQTEVIRMSYTKVTLTSVRCLKNIL